LGEVTARGDGERREATAMAKQREKPQGKKIRKTAAAQQAREVVRQSNESTQENREKEVGPQLPHDSKQTRREMGKTGPQVPSFLTMPDAGVFICRAGTIRTSILFYVWE